MLLEYDGTLFHGFQRLPEGRTVQGLLEEGLGEVCGHPVRVTAAGRTDAGVHALGQVVHFDTTSAIPAERLPGVLNVRTAPEVVARKAEETSPEFHARFSALRRTYHYHVSREQPGPFAGRWMLYERGLAPDGVERMRAALPALIGRHDFAPFAAAEQPGPTVRTLYRAEIAERGPLLRVELTADAFLRNMVRRITGLLLAIGRGARKPEAAAETLAGRAPGPPAATAPAHGLMLVSVEYPDGFGRPAAEAWPPFMDREQC